MERVFEGEELCGAASSSHHDRMTETETITVAEVSEGPGGDGGDPGTEVSLPVVELLTGRGFVTGKSGSGKSNTASVIIENLLSNNFPVLIVDTDGEYYGLKEAFEILHVGADEECDIQVSPEHAEKIASLALEQNVPIILDVSGYIDEGVAEDLLLRVSRQLFAKEKKLKKPFLMLVEECHEYIPEGGGVGEAGKMLIKIGKRGRKHGLGIVGISQRPADVKKDYITQCDWLVWHRLTWGNDTKVVKRILGSEYADEIEDMNNGEGFLMTDWSESIRRVQFNRKTTFDAGATPGLDDFERPELKSVSGDLVSELRDISDEEARQESEIADLRQELDMREQRIRQLERELEEARDLSRMADKFAQAMLQKAEAPYRGGTGQNLRRTEAQAELHDYERDGDENEVDDERAAANDQRAAANDQRAVTNGETADDAEADATDTSGDWPTVSNRVEREESTPERRTADMDADEAVRFVAEHSEVGTQQAVIDELVTRVESLDDLSRGMLRHYRAVGVADPVDAHIAAGGDGDERLAYSRNRPIRQTGLITHVGRGEYAYLVPELIRDAYADRLDRDELDEMIEAVERAFVDDEGDDGGDRGESTESDESTWAEESTL